MLYADRIVAHAELNAGLPETKVGIIPGWGGCGQLLLRAQSRPETPGGPVASALGVFRAILAGKPSTSAADARSSGILRLGGVIAMNRNQLIAIAKCEALAMLAQGYKPPFAAAPTVGDRSAKAGLMNEIHMQQAAGQLTDADVSIAERLAHVLTGGDNADPARPVSETRLMELELEAVRQLLDTAASRERIAHMLATGKALRN